MLGGVARGKMLVMDGDTVAGTQVVVAKPGRPRGNDQKGRRRYGPDNVPYGTEGDRSQIELHKCAEIDGFPSEIEVIGRNAICPVEPVSA